MQHIRMRQPASDGRQTECVLKAIKFSKSKNVNELISVNTSVNEKSEVSMQIHRALHYSLHI